MPLTSAPLHGAWRRRTVAQPRWAAVDSTAHFRQSSALLGKMKSHCKQVLRLNDGERATLAEIGKRLGRKALQQVACVAGPDTILAWYRRLIAHKFDGSKQRRAVGRPRTTPEILHLDSRKVTIGGITEHPDVEWMQQMARNATPGPVGASEWMPVRFARPGHEVLSIVPGDVGRGRSKMPAVASAESEPARICREMSTLGEAGVPVTVDSVWRRLAQASSPAIHGTLPCRTTSCCSPPRRTIGPACCLRFAARSGLDGF
jgi:hypothetical protein